jgi:transposase
VNTTDQAVSIGRRRRRRHSAAFKAESVAACRHPGVSIAATALARGLNANLLRRWVVEAERTGAIAVPARSTAATDALESTQSFMPIALASGTAEGAIRIEVRRGSSTVSVQWPVTAARECALLLRELVR